MFLLKNMFQKHGSQAMLSEINAINFFALLSSLLEERNLSLAGLQFGNKC